MRNENASKRCDAASTGRESEPMADRWRYSQGDHPPYCTCVECSSKRAQDDNRPDKGPIKRLVNWIRRLVR